MNITARDRRRAKEAYWILNSFIGDFIAAERSIEIIQTPGPRRHLSEPLISVLRRLFLMHLVLSLARFAEFYEHYGSVIPDEMKAQCKSIYKEIQARKVRAFRNSYVGHIWDREKKRPLDAAEVDTALSSIFRSSPGDFLKWINDSSGNNIGQNIAAMVERTRDEIRRCYGFNDSDLSF